MTALERAATDMLRVDIDDDEVDSDHDFCLYRGEPFTGELVEYGSDGSTVELTTYKDGLTDGPSRSWYWDGTLKRESTSRRGAGSAPRPGPWRTGARWGAGVLPAGRRQRPCRALTLSPKVQPLEPSQLMDQVIRPFSWPLKEPYACETRLGAM